MCRNIKPLFNFDPPAKDAEIRDAALQFVRKISGYHEPSSINTAAFNRGIDEISHATKRLLDALVTDAQPRNREVEAAKAHDRATRRWSRP